MQFLYFNISHFITSQQQVVMFLKIKTNKCQEHKLHNFFNKLGVPDIAIIKKRTVLFADDMILYTENPKDAPKSYQSSSLNSVKLQDTKLIYRNLLHFYILTAKYQKEVKEIISFTIVSQRIKYLGINLPKEVKEVYLENYKTLMRKIQDDRKI